MKTAVLFGALVLGLTRAGQQPKFTSSTSLVRLEAGVSDVHGTVRGLRSSDFVVTDRGARQTVRVDERADAPLDLVLVAQPIASVASTSAEQAARMAPAISAVLDRVEARDRLGVILAGAPPTRLRALESGRPSFDLAVFLRGVFAASFDALSAALGEFDRSDRRRVLVAITNGVDARSTVSFEALTAMASRLGPAFVVVGMPFLIPPQNVRAVIQGVPGADATASMSAGNVFPQTLELLARRTGGITLNLAKGDPAQLIADLFTSLRTQYVISYEPPAGKGWHPVSVTVSRRDAKVTVREGYFVG